MKAMAGITRSPLPAVRQFGAIAATVPLAAAGYVMFTDARLAGLAIGAVVLAVWAAAAYQHPRRAVLICLALLLVATTKFRGREPDASLMGLIDAQIVFEIVAFAVIGIGALAAFVAWRKPAHVSRIEILIAVYVPIALLSALWSAAPALTVVRGLQLLIIALLAIVAVRVLGPSQALRAPCVAAGVYAMCLAALAAVFPWARFGYESAVDRVRFAWFSVHPIEVGTLAAIAAVGLIAAICWRPRDRDGSHGAPRLWYAAACCSIAVLVLTNSRGPILAFAAALATIAFFRLPARLRPAIVAAGAVPVIVVLATGPDVIAWLFRLNTQDTVVAQFLLQGDSADELLGMNGRTDLWTTIRPEVEAHAVLGYGYHASRSMLLDAATYWTPAYAHNALLQSLLDIGIAGTVPLALIVVVALSSVFRSGLDPAVRGMTAALSVFLALNAVTTESFAGAPALDMLMLCLCALCAWASPSPVWRDERA